MILANSKTEKFSDHAIIRATIFPVISKQSTFLSIWNKRNVFKARGNEVLQSLTTMTACKTVLLEFCIENYWNENFEIS